MAMSKSPHASVLLPAVVDPERVERGPERRGGGVGGGGGGGGGSAKVFLDVVGAPRGPG